MTAAIDTTATEAKTFTLTLGPLDSLYAEEIRAWRNNYAIWQFTRQNDYLTDLEQTDWMKRLASDPTVKMYRIELTDGETARIVGVCGFTSIDYRNSRAEFSLYIAPGFQKRGLGKRALSILLTHGFDNHGFRSIYGETFADNPAARMFEGLGFKWEGTRREFYYKAGRHIDAHLYSILREEWLTNGRDALRAPDPADGRGGDKLPRPSKPVPISRRKSAGGSRGLQGANPRGPEGAA